MGPNKDTRTAAIMKAQMDRIGETLLENIEKLPDIVEEKKDFFLAGNFKKIYACACGDSLYAIRSARFAFRKYSGIDFEVIESHEMCRYEMDYIPKDALILPVSNNGNAARTNECCYQAIRRGYPVLTITSNVNGRIYSACDNRLFYTVPRLGHVPGTVSASTLMLMLIIFAVKIGTWTGHLTEEEAAAVYEKLRDAANLADRAVKECDRAVAEAVQANKDLLKYYFLAAGPNFGMAEFACAKLFEASAVDGIAIQTEEFAHEQYFVANMHPDNCFMLLAPNGRAVQRTKEILHQINFLGCYSIYVTTQPYAGDVKASKVIVIPGEIDEELSPFVMLPVASLFGYHYSLCHDGRVIHFACDEQEPDHFYTVHYSRFHEEVKDMDTPLPEDVRPI